MGVLVEMDVTWAPSGVMELSKPTNADFTLRGTEYCASLLGTVVVYPIGETVFKLVVICVVMHT